MSPKGFPIFAVLIYTSIVLGLTAAILAQIYWTRRKRRRNAQGFPIQPPPAPH